MDREFARLLDRLPEFQAAARDISEILLTNLVMASEIPAPTFDEQMRTQFLLDRLNEYELQNTSTDEAGNALGILPGKSGDGNILVVAHMDTVFPAKVDHTVSIEPNVVSGAGIGDDSLGLAAMMTLPVLLNRLGIELKNNLILMGSARSLGRGDIEGIRFFLDNKSVPISTGICVEGVKLGRLSNASNGMLRGEIHYRVPEEYDWTRFGAGGAIVNINDVINRILEIPLPRRPRTSIVLNNVEAGASFNTIPRQARLQFEIRSESGEIVRTLGDQIGDIAAETSSQTGAEVTFNVLARRQPGGIAFSNPLASHARAIIKALGVHPRISPSTSELSAFIDKGIPAVTIGITEGEHHNEENERLAIEPMYLGLAQLVGLLLAVDGGYLDGSE
ncbi:MAG: M20/M25/M40 family metallo-hydrolase [Spirochaeta sp.]|jgi:tripeptide aminopeptidase|nr:M20/M25/M40 family metallo-hydrolase [Spirochaeta sp.]